jgi:hypothetical protein
MADLCIRAAGPGDRETVARILHASWGGTAIVVHGTRYDALELRALLAEEGNEEESNEQDGSPAAGQPPALQAGRRAERRAGQRPGPHAA